MSPPSEDHDTVERIKTAMNMPQCGEQMELPRHAKEATEKVTAR